MVGDGLHQLVMHDWLGAFRLAELSLAILVDLASVGGFRTDKRLGFKLI